MSRHRCGCARPMATVDIVDAEQQSCARCRGAADAEAAERLPDLPHGAVADAGSFRRWADAQVKGPDIWGPWWL